MRPTSVRLMHDRISLPAAAPLAQSRPAGPVAGAIALAAAAARRALLPQRADRTEPSDLDLYVANLLGTLNRYEVLPRILGDLPALRAVLQQDSPCVRDNANRLLKRLRNQTRRRST